jgi:hypothetical protein
MICRYSGAMRSIEPSGAQLRTENLEIDLRALHVEIPGSPCGRPGMTEQFYSVQPPSMAWATPVVKELSSLAR